MSAPPVVWITVPRVDLARYLRRRGVHWPFPFDSAHVGRWEPSLAELLAGSELTPAPADAQVVCTLLENILRVPAYCAYVIRAVNGHETLHAAVGAGGDVVALVDDGTVVRLAPVGDTHIAATLAGELPALREVTTPGARLSARTAARVAAAITGTASEDEVRDLLTDAGIPDTLAARMLPGAAVVASGTVGAVRYAADGMWVSGCSASWAEFADGAVISSRERAGDVRWDPLSTNALGHAVADALTGLAS